MPLLKISKQLMEADADPSILDMVSDYFDVVLPAGKTSAGDSIYKVMAEGLENGDYWVTVSIGPKIIRIPRAEVIVNDEVVGWSEDKDEEVFAVTGVKRVS